MFQVYGIGQALIPVLPPPLPFESAPTSNQTNYEIGQVVFTPPRSPTAFYMYGGSGNWIEIASNSGNIIAINGTASQVTVTTVAGTATVSLPSAITTPGSLTTTTSLSATTTVTAGTGVTATTGGVTASAGNIVATLGNITASAGNIAATLGSVSAGTTVTAGTGVTATTGNIVATAGAVNAGTSMTATLGNITATNGNLVMGTAGNKIIVPTGSNASAGTSAAMSGTPGVVTVATTACSATAKVFYSRATAGGTLGNVSITAQDGTGFTLTSTANETSTFNWWIINA